MEFLQTLEFNSDQINYIVSNTSSEVIDDINNHSKVIENNIIFLRDLGVTNYKDIFTKYSEFFIREPDIFQNTLNKYDRLDLIAKLLKNMAIFVRL